MIEGNEATTPPSKEESTPQEEKGASTSAKPKEGEEETPQLSVEELQGQVKDLTGQVTQAENLQSQADRKAKAEKKLRIALELKLKGSTSGENLEEEDLNPPTPTGESQEVLIGVQNLLLGTPEYLALLKQDQTLSEVLRKDPAVLIGDYLDAEDAVEQVKAVLDKRLVQMKESEKAAKKPDKEEEGKEFDVPSQPAEEKAPPKEEKKEQGATNNLDVRVEESIKSKIKVE